MHTKDLLVEQLCPACGLCCNGVIFADVRLQPGEDAGALRGLGLPVKAPASASRSPRWVQPCAAFDGCRCRIYMNRPQYCRQFECVLLKSVRAGRTEPTAARRIIRTGRERAEKVRRLLRALGDTDEQLPLSARFRRAGRRLMGRDLEDETADVYGQLTLAVHDLNLLLGDAFYPGSAGRESRRGVSRGAAALVGVALAFLVAASPVRADQVELRNGDRYVGHVLSLNSNSIVLESDMLGTVRLPRTRVAIITLGPVPATNSPALPLGTNAFVPAASATSASGVSNRAPALSGLSLNTNLMQQVQKQFLSGAGPEANAKFNDLLSGLLSGKLGIEDIRAEAKSAADQLRALQRESGEDTGFASSAYLKILDHFLKETEPPGSATNAPASGPPPKPAPDEKEE